MENIVKVVQLIKQLKAYVLNESYSIEFKKATDKLPKSFWETYSSFSNTN